VTAIGLSLGMALSYGVANYVGPVLNRRLPLPWVVLAVQLVALIATALLVLATGAPAPASGAIAIGLLGGLLNVAALGAYYMATATGAISVASPLGATGGIIPVIAGFAAGERPSAPQLGGICLALSAGVLAARVPPSPDEEQRAQRRASVYAIASGILFGFFLVLFARAAEDGVLWAVLDLRLAAVAVALVATGAAGLFREPPWEEAPKLAVPGLFLTIGTVCFAAASTEGLLSVVTPVSTLFPVITVLLALVLLRERLTPSQKLGVAFALMSLCLIAFG
jgi:drug/metabolite transporter (DMT)-like permease